jgi:Ca2+-binding EF-hand superfamily protein
MGFYNLKRLVSATQIGQHYGYEKNLQFIDQRGDKITIQNDDLMRAAIFGSVQTAFEQYFAYFQSIGHPVPSPLELPSAEIRLLVSGAQYQMAAYPGLPANTDYRTYMFQSEKEKYLRDLSVESRIELTELMRMYDEFVMATASRGSDGRIDLRSFEMFMAKIYGPRNAARELFYAVDVERKNVIEFRNFIVALGLLRYGSLEDKIWIAFRAFNFNGSNSFEQDEMAQMIKSMNELKGVVLSQYDIASMVAGVFAKFDYDRDGHLNYQEFREAMLSNIDSLTPFFNSFAIQTLGGPYAYGNMPPRY